jgi:dipeptidyl aminopeptidase/acylaminoacyl peptidase
MDGGRLRGRLPLFLVAALVAVTVTACADQDNQRRFANEPQPTVDLASLAPTVSPSLPSPVMTPPEAPPLVSPEALLVARGAPKVFYVQADRTLLAFSAQGGRPAVLLTGDAGDIASFDASPSGDRVAVLLVKGGHYSTVILDAAGKELARSENLDRLVLGGHATPAAEEEAGRDLIDWSPQGDRLLVTFGTGGIVTVPLRGDPAVILTPQQAPGPIDAAWSPAGDAIAYVNHTSSTGSAGLYLVSTASQPATPRALVEPDAQGGSSVRRLAWHPSGRSILYTRSSSTDGLAVGGDLFQIAPSGGGPTIVASAGRVAPISAIVDFVPSPDGRAVAYTIVVPGPNGPMFNSLWVQQLGTDNRQKLSAAAGSAVNELWWTASGVVWRASADPTAITPEQLDAPFTLFQAGRGGEVTPIYHFQPPAGTPVASPVASPSAASSPVASPSAGNATPVASPSTPATPSR